MPKKRTPPDKTIQKKKATTNQSSHTICAFCGLTCKKKFGSHKVTKLF